MPFDLKPIQIPAMLWHARPSIDEHTQLLAIGDIHGCGRLLTAMMRAFQTVSARHLPKSLHREIVVLGDFIDRGPSSLSVLQALYGSRNHDGMTVLMGNHEAALIDFIDGRSSPFETWLEFGGDAFLRSICIEPPGPWEPEQAFRDRLIKATGEHLIDWMRDLPHFCERGDFFFCHAGVRPGIAVHEQSPHDLLWIRKPFLTSRRHHGKLVVHGHSIEPEICVRSNRIGIDTGAYRTGRLSGLILQGSSAWNITVWLD